MIQNEPLSINLRQVANLYSTIIEKKVYESESNFHFETLLSIYNNETPLLQSRLAESLHIDKSHMTSIVYYLLSEGFIDVEPNILDRRDSMLKLTPKGLESIEKLQEVVHQINRKITFGIPKDRLENFCDTLQLLTTNLEKEYELISEELQSKIA